MAQPYVGEIRMFAGNFAPAGWMFCNGSIVSIAENETLFNLIGTTYGGDGQSTFALPNLQSRVPIHQGSGFTLAQTGGAETITLTANQMPAHSHPMVASSNPAGAASPTNAILGTTTQVTTYFSDPPTQNMNVADIGAAGGNQPHNNIQPFLCISFIISLYGIFPSPN
jgi:microcystin-dependent protein